jgi:hypothetical protein
MVSSSIMRIAAAVLIGAVASAQAAPFHGLGPRIPSHAKHVEVLARRAASQADMTTVVTATCIDPDEYISFNDETVASLSICGGISGASTGCAQDVDPEVPPMTTSEGEFRSAHFSISAVDNGAVLTISKDRWIGCVEAARTICPTGSLTAVCAGGASPESDVKFTLTSTVTNEL